MSEPYIGEIRMFGGSFAPKGWALCNGDLIAISSNEALFSILGTAFGGDGRTDFALPDLRGRIPINAGGTGTSGPGLPTVRWGEKGGAIDVTLSANEIAAHTHGAKLRGINQTANATEFTGNALANTGSTNVYFSSRGTNTDFVDMQSDSVIVEANTGGTAFSVRNPYLGVNFIIALVGIFPSRN